MNFCLIITLSLIQYLNPKHDTVPNVVPRVVHGVAPNVVSKVVSGGTEGGIERGIEGGTGGTEVVSWVVRGTALY